MPIIKGSLHLKDDKKALFHKEKGFCMIYKKLLGQFIYINS